ncbi:MAG: arginase family protein [Bacteroidota bacterium]|nr:arginase family protein [Bacteroidota bacterium]
MVSRRPIHIIQLISDLGANPAKQGAAFGPTALIDFDKRHQNILSSYPCTKIEVPETFSRPAILYPFARYVDIIGRHQLNAREQISSIIEQGNFPFILSGDHSNAASAIAAIRNQNPDKKIGVIWIDAHADLHTPYTTPSGNMHGMPVAISLGIDNNIYNKNKPCDIEVAWWEKLKTQNGLAINSVNSRDIAFVGIRDLEEEEWDYIHAEKIKYYSPADINGESIEQLYQSIMEYFNDYDLLYVSFDIDSMDNALVPGTGTPVVNGLTKEQAGELLNSLWNTPKVCGVEIAEINPKIEKETTLKNVYGVLEKMFSLK